MRKLRFIILFTLLTMVVGVSSANPPNLPNLPQQQAVQSVVSQTNGVTLTPLGVSSTVVNTLNAFGGAFTSISLDTANAVHYIDLNGTLKESVIPRAGMRTAALDPDMTTPGNDARPGKIIGAVHQPSRGMMWVVAVFKPNAFNCPGCEPPEKIRLYYNATEFHEYSIVWSTFFDNNGDNMVEAVDEGAVIAHSRSCITIGLEQACWQPYSYSDVRQEPQPKDIAYNAYTALNNAWDMKVDFYVDDAMPDIYGLAQRNACAAYLANATVFNNMTACIPNVVITAAKENKRNRPIAIMVVLSSADVRTFDVNANPVGSLPPGDYVVRNAENANNHPGTATALFFTNLAGTGYMVPTTVVQGFGNNSSFDSKVAGIKDGLAGYRLFGW